MLKQPNFFYSQSSTLLKEALSKFYLSTTFGLSVMISSVAPKRSSTSYTYLITKIGNRNVKGYFSLKIGIQCWKDGEHVTHKAHTFL